MTSSQNAAELTAPAEEDVTATMSPVKPDDPHPTASSPGDAPSGPGQARHRGHQPPTPSGAVLRERTAALLRDLAVPGRRHDLSASALAALAVLLESGARGDPDVIWPAMDRLARRLHHELSPQAHKAPEAAAPTAPDRGIEPRTEQS